jgi:hypothetical protein
MSQEISTKLVVPNGDREEIAASKPLQKPAASLVNKDEPDAETIEALQKIEKDMLRILSKRSRLRKLWMKIWKRSHPELMKVYGIIHNHLVEIQRLLILRQESPPANFKAIEQQLQPLLNQEYEELRAINIHAAWEYAGALERFLLLLGDDEYLLTRLIAEERREKKAALGSWSEYLDREKLAELLKEFKSQPVEPKTRSRVVESLSYIYAERIRYTRHQRAREELKADYLNGLTFFLTLLLLLLLQCVYLAAKTNAGAGLITSVGNLFWSLLTFNFVINLQSQEIRNALVAGITGALGSTLSGFYKLRDEEGGITALRSFRSAMWAQPFVGAVVGVLLWLLLLSGMIAIGVSSPGQGGDILWTKLSVFCFLAGFSEPFFLGLVQRVAGAADKATSTAKKNAENKNANGKG